MAGVILLIIAFVFAVLAALSVPNFGRVQHGWAAIAFLIASMLAGHAGFR